MLSWNYSIIKFDIWAKNEQKYKQRLLSVIAFRTFK
jgi:hypothetical protein